MKRCATILLLLLLPGLAGAADLMKALEGLGFALADDVEVAKLKRVGIPEFLNGQDNLGGETGAIGLLASRRLQLKVVKAARNRFAVVERQQLERVLAEEKIEASGLTSKETSQTLVGKIDGLDGLVVGTMTRVGTKLHVDAQIVKLPEATVVGGAEAVVDLDADLLAEGGYLVTETKAGGTVKSDDVRKAVDRRRQQQPPALPSDLPYGVQVLMNNQPVPVYRHAGDLWLGFSPGDVYTIKLINRTKEPVAVALYIDGLNSLRQQQSLPSQGSKWIIGPRSEGLIKGWQMDQNTAREFKIVGFGESLAARRHFTEQIGLITAAFYPPADGSEARGAVGTGEGNDVSSVTRTVQFKATREPAAIIPIRYDAKEIVEKYELVTAR